MEPGDIHQYKGQSANQPSKDRSRLAGLALLFVALLAAAALPGAGAAQDKQSGGQAQPDSNPTNSCPPDGQCFADVPPSSPFFNFANSVYRDGVATGYQCGGPGEPCDQYSRPYFRPASAVTRGQMSKFADLARKQPGISIDTASSLVPIYSRTSVQDGRGMQAESVNGNGMQGVSYSSGASGVFGVNTVNGFGVAGNSRGQAVFGESIGGDYGVHGKSAGTAVFGESTGGNIGVHGKSSGKGVFGESTGANAVQGTSTSSSNSGVYGLNTNLGFGIAGRSNGTGIFAAVFGENTGSGNAGYFAGNVVVSGTCCASAEGTFRIDHPQDPANKYLTQAAVAAPEMLNVYSGNVTTDAGGAAIVTLPAYVEALNTDFRYQLTVVGRFAQAIVQTEVKDNRFTIATDKPNVKVSWQITGVRHDPYAEAHPLAVEQTKPTNEQGLYLHPELYGQPDSKRVDKAPEK